MSPASYPFEVPSFLDYREAIPDFTLVEFGYGQNPIFHQQPHHFTGFQQYIGIEAGLRDRNRAQEILARYQEQVQGKNVCFLFHDVGPGVVSFCDPNGIYDEIYTGIYKPETALDENIADEIFASNVFCDPLLAASYQRTHDLLGEMRRLLKPDGTIVLRETITPGYVDCIGEYSLGRIGLKQVAKVMPSSWQDWHELETVYGTHNAAGNSFTPLDDSYYMFIKPTE